MLLGNGLKFVVVGGVETKSSDQPGTKLINLFQIYCKHDNSPIQVIKITQN
jgi:hypothetical protein